MLRKAASTLRVSFVIYFSVDRGHSPLQLVIDRSVRSGGRSQRGSGVLPDHVYSVSHQWLVSTLFC